MTAFSTTPAFYTFTRELNWVGGLRARAGFGGENVLIYGTGGAAWAGLDHSFTTSNTVNTAVEDAEDMAWGYQLAAASSSSLAPASGRRVWNICGRRSGRGSLHGSSAGPARDQSFILGNATAATCAATIRSSSARSASCSATVSDSASPQSLAVSGITRGRRPTRRSRR